jgi:exopolyphosphatase/pppGpp-phosphohydrolase
MTRIFAAADTGSNTAHLLVASMDENLVMRTYRGRSKPRT